MMLRNQVAPCRAACRPALAPFAPVRLPATHTSVFRLAAAAVEAVDEDVVDDYIKPQQTQTKREKPRSKRFKAMQAKVPCLYMVANRRCSLLLVSIL